MNVNRKDLEVCASNKKLRSKTGNEEVLEAGFTGERRDVNRSCLRIRLILLQSVRLTAAPRCRTHGETLQRFVVVALVQIFWVTDFTDSSMYGVSGRVTRHPTDLQSLA